MGNELHEQNLEYVKQTGNSDRARRKDGKLLDIVAVIIALLAFCAAAWQGWVTRDTEIRQLRAYVGPNLSSGLGLGPTSTRLTLSNFGSTPAANVKVFSSWDFVPLGKDLPADYTFEARECADADKDIPSAIFLFNGTPIPSVRRHCVASDEIANLIKAERKEQRAFYYGYITYDDVFGEHRKTTFCMWYTVPNTALCDRHNDIDPGK